MRNTRQEVINESMETVIGQFSDKNYTDRLRHYAGNILCVGIGYEKTDAKDVAYKEHTCVIDQM